MKNRIVAVALVILLAPVGEAIGGTVYTNRAAWLGAVGGLTITEDFDGISSGAHASPLPVAWGTVTSPFGIFVHPFGAGGLSLGASSNALNPSGTSIGFGLDVGGGQFSTLNLTIMSGNTVLLSTTARGQTFFGWQPGPNEVVTSVLVSSAVGLLEIDNVTFAFSDAVHTQILSLLSERLDAKVSSRASQESLDGLAVVVRATSADVHQLAGVAATETSLAALSAKVDALSAAVTALTNQLAVVRQLVEDLQKKHKK